MTPSENWAALKATIESWNIADQEDMGSKFALDEGVLRYAHTKAALKGDAPSSSAPSTAGAVFPPYGRSKGLPVSGATKQDLDFYRGGCLRSLDDPGKERFHAKERALLTLIEAELAK